MWPRGASSCKHTSNNRAPKWDTINATPRTQSNSDNALNPVDAARLLPHSGRRERKELQDTVRETRTFMEMSWQ